MWRNSAGLSFVSVMTVLSFDDDFAGHPCPIVVGAAEWVPAPTRHEKHVLLLTGLHENLGAIGIHGSWIANLRTLEKPRRRELVRLLAVILQMETIRHPRTEGQAVRLEPGVGGERLEVLRIRWVVRWHGHGSDAVPGR